MIKLRSADGTEIKVADEPYFIEICDPDDKVGLLFYEQNGYVVQVVPGSPEAERYEQVYGRPFLTNLVDISNR